ncbi:MAG TPA: hypothetical protein VFT29_10925 [Gemmatimonadaceae bacterium]|nr:hypothetical protein [Gemmatimonadaceae bacterium]
MTPKQLLFLVMAGVFGVAGYAQLKPRVDCNALNWKYNAPTPRPGMVPLGPPPMSAEKCAKSAATFKAHDMEVPMLPRFSRPVVWLLGFATLGSLVLATRRQA